MNDYAARNIQPLVAVLTAISKKRLLPATNITCDTPSNKESDIIENVQIEQQKHT